MDMSYIIENKSNRLKTTFSNIHSEESNPFLRIRSVQQREHIFVENDNRKSLSLHHELCNYVIWRGRMGGGGRLLMAMEIQEFSSFS